MRLDWLDDILAVIETGSFTDAAERRCLTPSAFSRRIQGIEDHLGVALFDRGRKPVQLQAGLRRQSGRIARLAGDLRELVADLRQGDRVEAGRVVLSSQHALTATLTPLVLQEIGRRRGDVYVRMRSANLADCFAQLLARQADIAIVYRLPDGAHPFEGPSIESMALGRDRLVPVIGAGTADALSERRAQGELPYIAYPPDVFFGQVMEGRILPRVRDAAHPRPVAETALTLASMEMAGVGIAVAWVPETLARDRLREGRLLDLSDDLPDCGLEVSAVRLSGDAGGAEAAVWESLGAIRGLLAAQDGRAAGGAGPLPRPGTTAAS